MTPTREQLQTLARKLLDRGGNVYSIAESVCGEEVGEEIFDLLREHEEIFKCENCDDWMPLAHEGLRDICADCLDNIDGKNDE